jgi:hypothetical protein
VSAQAVIRLVAWAVGRPEWGRAMLAELEQISAPRSRRRFAFGCLHALALSAPAVVAGFLVAGLLSVAVVLAALIGYPGVVTGLGTWLAVGCFFAVIVGYVVAAAGLAARLVHTKSTARALVTGAAIAGSWMVVGLSASAAHAGVPMTLLALGPAVALVLGWRTTRRASSPRTGVQCVGLAALVAGFALFLLWAGQTVIFAGRPYDAGMVRDFRSSGAPDLATYAVSDSLGTGMMLLLLVPLISLAAGVIGAVMATRRPRPGTTS